jgi:hypothetical protein
MPEFFQAQLAAQQHAASGAMTSQHGAHQDPYAASARAAMDMYNFAAYQAAWGAYAPQHQGGGGDPSTRCYQCQGFGHLARDCPTPKGPGGGKETVKCYRCGQPGHWARECTGHGGMASGPTGCHKCGMAGHKSAECTSPVDVRSCFKCGQTGHVARACPNDNKTA